jgi:hypothetical protein
MVSLQSGRLSYKAPSSSLLFVKIVQDSQFCLGHKKPTNRSPLAKKNENTSKDMKFELHSFRGRTRVGNAKIWNFEKI